MEIIFSDVKIRDLCCCRTALISEFGSEIGRKICTRLSMLAAATSLAEISRAPPVSLTAANDQGLYSVAVGSDHSLVFQAAVVKMTQARDLAKIYKIQIIGPAPAAARRGIGK